MKTLYGSVGLLTRIAVNSLRPWGLVAGLALMIATPMAIGAALQDQNAPTAFLWVNGLLLSTIVAWVWAGWRRSGFLDLLHTRGFSPSRLKASIVTVGAIVIAAISIAYVRNLAGAFAGVASFTLACAILLSLAYREDVPAMLAMATLIGLAGLLTTFLAASGAFASSTIVARVLTFHPAFLTAAAAYSDAPVPMVGAMWAGAGALAAVAPRPYLATSLYLTGWVVMTW